MDECSEKCKKLSPMFAYGTNDFERDGCINGLCKCLCVNSDDDSTCESINQEEYWVYEFKDAGKP